MENHVGADRGVVAAMYPGRKELLKWSCWAGDRAYAIALGERHQNGAARTFRTSIVHLLIFHLTVG